MTLCESRSYCYRNGSFLMAISREVNDGKGAQFFVGNGTRTRRGSRIRTNRPENWEGWLVPRTLGDGESSSILMPYLDQKIAKDE
jgi:hypothetical protein